MDYKRMTLVERREIARMNEARVLMTLAKDEMALADKYGNSKVAKMIRNSATGKLEQAGKLLGEPVRSDRRYVSFREKSATWGTGGKK